MTDIVGQQQEPEKKFSMKAERLNKEHGYHVEEYTAWLLNSSTEDEGEQDGTVRHLRTLKRLPHRLYEQMLAQDHLWNSMVAVFKTCDAYYAPIRAFDVAKKEKKKEKQKAKQESRAVKSRKRKHEEDEPVTLMDFLPAALLRSLRSLLPPLPRDEKVRDEENEKPSATRQLLDELSSKTRLERFDELLAFQLNRIANVKPPRRQKDELEDVYAERRAKSLVRRKENADKYQTLTPVWQEYQTRLHELLPLLMTDESFQRLLSFKPKEVRTPEQQDEWNAFEDEQRKRILEIFAPLISLIQQYPDLGHLIWLPVAKEGGFPEALRSLGQNYRSVISGGDREFLIDNFTTTLQEWRDPKKPDRKPPRFRRSGDSLHLLLDCDNMPTNSLVDGGRVFLKDTKKLAPRDREKPGIEYLENAGFPLVVNRKVLGDYKLHVAYDHPLPAPYTVHLNGERLEFADDEDEKGNVVKAETALEAFAEQQRQNGTPLPPKAIQTAYIKRIALVLKRSDVFGWKGSFQVTVESPRLEPLLSTEKTLFVNYGYRSRGDGIRSMVAYGSDGAFYELKLPYVFRTPREIKYLQRLIKHKGTQPFTFETNDGTEALSPLISDWREFEKWDSFLRREEDKIKKQLANLSPEEMAEWSSTARAMVSRLDRMATRGLHALHEELVKTNIEDVIRHALSDWVARTTQYYRWREGARLAAMEARNSIYTEAALFFVRNYDRIIFTKVSMKDLGEKDGKEKDKRKAKYSQTGTWEERSREEKIAKAAQWQRHIVSVSEFQGRLKQLATKYGRTSPESLSGVETVCIDCGKAVEVTPALYVQCEKGHVFDQDVLQVRLGMRALGISPETVSNLPVIPGKLQRYLQTLDVHL